MLDTCTQGQRLKRVPKSKNNKEKQRGRRKKEEKRRGGKEEKRGEKEKAGKGKRNVSLT